MCNKTSFQWVRRISHWLRDLLRSPSTTNRKWLPMLVRVSPLFRTRIRGWKQVLENMPSATFSSSRSYVRRSRRKGGNRLPLPSRTQSGKSFCSWTRLYSLSCLAREACLLTDCFCFSRTEMLVLFDVHALIALWQCRWIGIDYLTYEYIIRKSFCVPF